MMGGSKENRHTPAVEHWSLAVKDGKALEKEWRNEIPIPRGGPHRFISLFFWRYAFLIYFSAWLSIAIVVSAALMDCENFIYLE